jgi:hypothetical protein
MKLKESKITKRHFHAGAPKRKCFLATATPNMVSVIQWIVITSRIPPIKVDPSFKKPVSGEEGHGEKRAWPAHNAKEGMRNTPKRLRICGFLAEAEAEI